jgi:spermidine synthase
MNWPTTYYATDSAIGLAMAHHPHRQSAQPLMVGVVGLGTGTIAALGQAGDTIRFYEINPDVIKLAQGHFLYLKNSAARIEVAEGDARLQLEREATDPGLPLLDILAVDAFSSDSIPTHLLTVESAQVYRRRLKPDGLLLLHISNRSLDLNPVARALAARLGWTAARFDSEDDPSRGTYSTTWVALTSNRSFLEDADISKTITAWKEKDRSPIEWTDNYTSLWRVLDL